MYVQYSPLFESKCINFQINVIFVLCTTPSLPRTLLPYFQGIRTLSKNGTLSKRSPNDSAASSPDITSRAILNRSLSSNNNNNNNQCNPHHANNNNNANGNNGVAMSETSDDSSLNSVDLDPMGKLTLSHLIENFGQTNHFIFNFIDKIDAGATYIDSDTGLESMSSAEATTKACSLCLDGTPNMMPAGPEIFQQIDGLRQEVTRLKCDKLDLLRQNVVST